MIIANKLLTAVIPTMLFRRSIRSYTTPSCSDGIVTMILISNYTFIYNIMIIVYFLAIIFKPAHFVIFVPIHATYNITYVKRSSILIDRDIRSIDN